MKQICQQFRLEGTPILCTPFGNGHINRTWLVVTNASRLYVLQRINNAVFRDVPVLMKNVSEVCRYLRWKNRDPRGAMEIIPTVDSADCLSVPDADAPDGLAYYRMLTYVTGGVCLDLPESAEDLYQAGRAFGAFQRQLADFPAALLVETIPHFHDTPDRFRQLHEAIEEDRAGRRAQVEPEIAALLSREGDGRFLMDLLHAERLPLRVTHNDTKLNNVMLDEKTHQPLCVLDLDTVMPGLVANDFGDAIRTGAATAAEDEPSVGLMGLSLPMYSAFTEGFLSECGDSLTPLEIETLPWGARLMTLEVAVRFLTDHLNGDVYFAVHREGHNLDRCRAQLALLTDMERNWETMCRIVQECAAKG